MKIGIIGIGFVGTAMMKSFNLKGIKSDDLCCYDKYKPEYQNFESLLKTDIIFLSLPTNYDNNTKEYDKSAIHETCQLLKDNNYSGLVVLKSTVEPGTTKELCNKYGLDIVHNPEFLSSRTAFEDFNNQTHIVIGNNTNNNSNVDKLLDFYKIYYPLGEISQCSSDESESMKLYCNCFYATKVQFFTEIYLMCQKNGSNYNTVKDLMLKNGWINPMHTNIPGPDGQVSYGGLCFPKDTNAMANYLKRNNSPSAVIESVITERNEMRDDHLNIK